MFRWPVSLSLEGVLALGGNILSACCYLCYSRGPMIDVLLCSTWSSSAIVGAGPQKSTKTISASLIHIVILSVICPIVAKPSYCTHPGFVESELSMSSLHLPTLPSILTLTPLALPHQTESRPPKWAIAYPIPASAKPKTSTASQNPAISTPQHRWKGLRKRQSLLQERPHRLLQRTLPRLLE